MEAIIPYLTFKGQTKEAFEFYAKALGGEIAFMQTFGESGQEVAEEDKNKVMHAMFKAGDLTIMASDTNSHHPNITVGDNVSLSLNFTDEASIDKTFAAMSEGSKITMPLEKTFWNAKFGMLTDKFGINWMFNHDFGEPNEK